MKYVIRLPTRGYEVFESSVRGTHAVLVRESMSDKWSVHGLYENEEKARAEKPMRRVNDNVRTYEEQASRDRGEDTYKPWAMVCVREVEGVVLPVRFLDRCSQQEILDVPNFITG